MEIIVGKTAGFCFGVKNAVTKAIEETNKTGEVYCLGELVHNKQVTNELIKKGINFIQNIEEAKNKIIIRSHGVTKQVYDKAKKQNLEIVDLTCPKVLKTHNIVEEYANKDFYIILTGDRKHPEMIGTASFCGKNHTIIEKEEEIEQAIYDFQKSNKNNLLIISQTTYSLEKFNKIVDKIKEKINNENLIIKNTICNATKERQEETENIAKKVDAMIIIGGRNSSNSSKLFDLSKKYCKKVKFIETAEELNITELLNINTIGIMAGASTPAKSIEDVIAKLRKI